jgi:hypothetical protein
MPRCMRALGNPDATTVFPQKMLIDYIHVCQN